VNRRAFAATQHYGDLVAATLPLLPSGGLLLCCANESGLKRAAFQSVCVQSIRAAGRTARIAYAGGASPIDHPQALGRDDPLKVILLEL
jgi:23S rRNA G2069 N7-methylase RlmK/C1962 C5-methylase RlmI